MTAANPTFSNTNKSPIRITVAAIIIAFIGVGLLTLSNLPSNTAASNQTYATINLPGYDDFLMPYDGEVIDIPSGPHSRSGHNPYEVDSKANVIVTSHISGFGGNNGDDQQCFGLFIGNALARVIYWTKTHVSELGTVYGNLSWFHAASQTWGGAFPDFNIAQMKVPGDIARDYPNASMKPLTGDNCPDPPALSISN